MTTLARRLTIAIAALAATACALTGTGDPSTAAVVGERRIDAAAIDENLESIRNSDAFRQQSAGDPSGTFVLGAQTQLTTAFVRSAILDLLAEREGVQISDAQVTQARDALVRQLGGEQAFRERLAQEGLSESFLLRQLRDQQTQTALQEQIGADSDLVEFIRTELEDVPVEVNPRYGQWDPESLSVVSYDPLAPEGGQAASGGP